MMVFINCTPQLSLSLMWPLTVDVNLYQKNTKKYQNEKRKCHCGRVMVLSNALPNCPYLQCANHPTAYFSRIFFPPVSFFKFSNYQMHPSIVLISNVQTIHPYQSSPFQFSCKLYKTFMHKRIFPKNC